MESQKETLQLRNNRVFIIAGVADYRPGLGLAGGIGSLGPAAREILGDQRGAQGATTQVTAEKERPTVGVQIGLVVGAPAVDVVEVEARRSEIHQCVRIVLALQAAGGVERQVMVDELSEIRIRGRDPALLGVGAVLRRLRRRTHRGAELPEGTLRGGVVGSEVSGWQ